MAAEAAAAAATASTNHTKKHMHDSVPGDDAGRALPAGPGLWQPEVLVVRYLLGLLGYPSPLCLTTQVQSGTACGYDSSGPRML